MDKLASGAVDDGGFGNVRFSAGLRDVGGDVVFMPVDATGGLGTLNRQVLGALGLERSHLPDPPQLRQGYAIGEYPSGRLCFVVSVGDGDTAEILRRNLTAALGDGSLRSARSLWLPLMGTGFGRLSPSISREVTLGALQAAGWMEQPSVAIVIAGPELGQSEEQASVVSRPGDPSKPLGGADTSAPNKPEVFGDAEGDESAEPNAAIELAAMDLEPAVAAVVDFAGMLRAGRKGKGGALSTSLLFYALAESQARGAPAELRSDPAAALFAGAVHSLAQGRYQEAWAEYFSATFRPAVGMSRPDRRPAATVNVTQVMAQAANSAREAGRDRVGVHDLVVALLSFPKGRDRLAVEKMGISMPELLAAYRDARIGQIGTTLLNDVASIDDRLGYRRYAAAITNFLLDADTPAPLSVSIQAPWGAGKSSLMQQIREALDPKDVRTQHDPKTGKAYPRLLLKDVLAFLNGDAKSHQPSPAEPGRRWTIWFNAWKYDTSDQVWAGLVDALVDQISRRLPPVERETFLLRLQLARIDDGIVRRKIYDRVVTIWWAQAQRWVLAALAAFGALFGVHKVVEILSPSGWEIAKLVAWSPYAPLIILAVYLAESYFHTRKKTRSEPADFSLSDYLQVPDYDRTLSTIHHIHQDLLRVLKVAPASVVDGRSQPTPVVIFIDDLDRCSPSKVAAVVEGVSMFLASEHYGCMFVIGMDPQMIAAALEDAHSKVRSRLPRYERTVPLGWRFMDKFIQLPFTIPPSHGTALKGYIDWLSGDTAGVAADHPEAVRPTSSDAPQDPRALELPGPDLSRSTLKVGPESEFAASPAPRIEVAFTESREVGRIIQEAAANTSGNPREIKRLANLTRLYLGLRNERRKAEPTWRSPVPSQYARWIVLTLRWPDMMRWLQWGADEFAWPEAYSGADLTTRRLQLLEDAAAQCVVARDWTNVLVANLSVPGDDESDWSTDPKLFEFFVQEAKLEPEERLSAAAAEGFW